MLWPGGVGVNGKILKPQSFAPLEDKITQIYNLTMKYMKNMKGRFIKKDKEDADIISGIKNKDL